MFVVLLIMRMVLESRQFQYTLHINTPYISYSINTVASFGRYISCYSCIFISLATCQYRAIWKSRPITKFILSIFLPTYKDDFFMADRDMHRVYVRIIEVHKYSSKRLYKFRHKTFVRDYRKSCSNMNR